MNTSSATATDSAWAPLANPLFRTLWIATLASNVGTWMHDVGAGWLMTSLTPSPVMVALIQTATSLPVFLLALPAGALSDIVDRRRYLIAVQIWLAIVAALLAWSAFSGTVTAWSLVGLTFAMGIGAAMMLPAWAAVVPEIVDKPSLQSAISLNSMGINVARAIGPAVAGVIISFAGTGAVFAVNALSYLGVIFVLYRWQRASEATSLPPERLPGAIRAGIRFACHAPELQTALVRGTGFFAFASASWALLPLIARNLTDSGPGTFGILVASVGVGAVAGALTLPHLRKLLQRDDLVAGATLVYAAALIMLAFLDSVLWLSLTMAASGAAWITVLSTLQVAAQMALPNWVRARGLALFMMTFMGAMALGSLAWGKFAEMQGTSLSLCVAAGGMVLAVLLTRRWKLGPANEAAVTPSMHWPTPSTHDGVDNDQGPVLITIQYQVAEGHVREFLQLLQKLSRSRRRDGAYVWSVFEDTEIPYRFIETFQVTSWIEHLRQHERVTDADREIQQDMRSLLIPGTKPIINHYVPPASSDAPATSP